MSKQTQHKSLQGDWSSDVSSSHLIAGQTVAWYTRDPSHPFASVAVTMNVRSEERRAGKSTESYKFLRKNKTIATKIIIAIIPPIKYRKIYILITLEIRIYYYTFIL